MPWRLAIDFGTTTTVAAIQTGNAIPQLLQLESDSTRMSSGVFLQQNGELVAGRLATNQAMMAPDRYEPTPKLSIDPTIPLGSDQIPVVNAIATVFNRVLLEAFRQRGPYPPDSIVLTHPVRWGDKRRDRLIAALKTAVTGLPEQFAAARMGAEYSRHLQGMPEPTMVSEPVAAAHHFANTYELPVDSCLLVYDLGGGTFDTAVVRRLSEREFDILAHGGLDDLGGVNFDAALFSFAGNTRLAEAYPDAWKRLQDPDADIAWQTNQRRMLEYVTLAKVELSTMMQLQFRLLDEPEVEMHIQRDDLNKIIHPDLDRSIDALRRTIDASRVGVNTFAGIYLVGASSRIPMVSDLLRKHLNMEPVSRDDPKGVVALGALYTNGDKPRPREKTSLVTTPIPAKFRRGLATRPAHRGELSLRRGNDHILVMNVGGTGRISPLSHRAGRQKNILKRKSGYRQLHYRTIAKSVYGHGCKERLYASNDIADNAIERYLHIGARDFIIAAPERCRDIIDSLEFDGPADRKGGFRVGVTASSFPDWSIFERIVLFPYGVSLLCGVIQRLDMSDGEWIEMKKQELRREGNGAIVMASPSTFFSGHPCEIVSIGNESARLGTPSLVAAVGTVDQWGCCIHVVRPKSNRLAHDLITSMFKIV